MKIPHVFSVFSLSRNQQTAPLPPSSTFLCFVIPCLQLVFRCLAQSTKQTWKSCFASSLTASNTKRANLTWLPLEIMHRGHTWHDYPWPWVSLTWLLYNLQLWRLRSWFRKFTVRFRPIRKEIVSWMYNNANIKFYYNNNDSWKSINQIQKYSLVWNRVW